MEGLINSKSGKMCSIATKFGICDKRTQNAYEILVWRLQFENGKQNLSKDWDFRLGFNSSHFEDYVKN
jgi:hypothetical protein